MSDESALLAAILAHPDEDTPRLMYADWLQENGQSERAEFIRIQCDATVDEAAGKRVDELEERNRGRWLAALQLPQFPGASWEFRRGFPEHLDVPGDLLMERYDAFARVPWLRCLSLYEMNNSLVRDFVSRQWPSQWEELELDEDDRATDVPDYNWAPALFALASSPQIARLQRLELSMVTLSPESEPALELLREHLGDRLTVN